MAVATGVADDQPLSPGTGNWIYISGAEHLTESSQSIPIFYYYMTIKTPFRSSGSYTGSSPPDEEVESVAMMSEFWVFWEHY